MKRTLKTLCCPLLLLLIAFPAMAQRATVSYPFAVGSTVPCGGTTPQIHFYNYNGATNGLTSITSNVATDPVGRYAPQLRIGTTNTSAQRFTSNIASVSYNPQDKNIYYLWTDFAPSALTQGAAARTFVWRWPAGSKPTGTAPRLDTLRSFGADILGVAFGANGNGYLIEFTSQIATTPPTYKVMLRSINFATGALGAADTLAFTGGAKIYQSGGGDVAMSPSGQMFFALDNKLFTPNYTAYTGTGQYLTCTYIDTVKNTTGSFVGLTYAEGQTVSAYSGGTCPFFEINPLTAATSPITTSGTMYSASDFATIISGIGVSKSLISATPTGTANQYDVVYEVYARNYGNTDITNFQITDSLGLINGNANVSNVSISFPAGGNPAGLTLNTTGVTPYTGTGLAASNHNLLNGTGTLPNYPVSNNFVTIRIACRLSNISSGITYNNTAIAKGTGYNSQVLRDSSTNGNMPDLNSNDKPDDLGESQPTPLLIAITAQTPPCSTLGQVFYKETFGTGANLSVLSTGQSAGTTYTGSTTQPLATDQFMVASNANAGDNSRFISLTDHTNGAGRMLIVNADATNKVFYTDTLNSLCGNQQYSLGFYAAFVGNPSYSTICDGFGGFKYPKVKMRVKDLATGLVITEISTANITSTSWAQYGMKWVMPTGYPNIIFELINDGQGGCGNDIAFDDIELGICDAAPVVTVSGATVGCLNTSTSMSADLNDPAAVPGTKQYQWQVSADNLSWADIGGASAATYTISNVSAADVGRYYRVLVAANGNIGSPTCRYTSPGYLLTAKSSSVAPTAVVRNRAAVCPGEPTSLRVTGGTFGTGAVYRWYSGSCGGTLAGTGSTISVSPSVTTTYFVRIEGDCNVTSCVSVTVTVSCDLDADDDGVPDVLESASVDPKLDDDFDGNANWRDADYAGFADSNGDGINDNFDTDKDGIPNFMDRDSDNDGIADVVESGGGDANGDGIIDSYSDGDADGFSDNVDANLGSHLSSGNGLGALDGDGDGVPNYLDLDSDNDGVPDVAEVYGGDSNNNGMIDGFADSDGDGLANSVDGDANGDAVVENTVGPLLRTGAVLSNGRAASYPNKNMDGDSKANPYDLDSDGDGIVDVIEAQFADLNYDGRIDGSFNARGWSTTASALGTMVLLNSDASGRANVYDVDSDDDGIPDGVEGMSTTAYLLASGGDTDGDGIDNTYDNISGVGGKGITPFNKDGDALPDYLDVDTDGDGLSDRIEGNDFNLNGKPDDDVVLTGVDTDGDGLDNKFDADNSTARGMSQYMGNGGSFAGPSSAGSRAMVQKTFASFSDRDWRQVEYILDLKFLGFGAVLRGEQVELSWEVLSYAGVRHYVVEESVDGVVFVESGRVSGAGRTGTMLRYSYRTAWKGGSKTYYRIKALQDDNKTITSNIQEIKTEEGKPHSIQVVPNPVGQNIRVVIFSDKSEEITLILLDSKGRRIREIKDHLEPGVNAIVISGAAQLPNGHYFISTYFAGRLYALPIQIRH